MRKTESALFIISATAVLALASGGCGGGGTECGEGTIEQDGACVPVLDDVCAEGTHLEGSQCVPDAECGPDTHLEDGRCVPDMVCGPGTHLQGGQCLPDAECGEGTVFDVATGMCVPAFDTICGNGTVHDEVTGGCLPDYDALCAEGSVWDEAEGRCILAEPDVLEGTENNDPLTGGEPADLDLPDEGTTLTVGGVVEPPADLLGDGTLSADLDGFAFEADEGQVIRFEGTSGPDMPSVAFLVARPDSLGDAPSSLSPVRYGLAMDGRNPVRTIRILESGTYWLLVTDKDNLAGTGLTGGGEMNYVVAVTLLPTPADGTVALGGTFTASLVGDPTVTAVTGTSEGTLVQVTVPDASSMNITRYLYVLDSTDGIAAATYDQAILWFFFPIGTQRFLVADPAGMKLFLDYSYNLTPDTDYEISVSEVDVTNLGQLAVASPISSAGHSLTTETQVDTATFGYTNGGGPEMVRIAATNVSPADDVYMVLRDETYAFVASGVNLMQFVRDAGATYYLDVMYGGTSFGGPYAYDLALTAEVITNVVAEAAGDNDSIATAQAVALDTMPALINGQFTPAGDVDFYAVTPAAATTLTMTLQTAALDTVIELYDGSGALLDYADAGVEGDPEILTADLTGGATTFIAVYEYWGDGTGPYTLLLSD
jgi:hypothetical protein